MTIPWLMNCPHVGSGWCLACVKELRKEADRYMAENARLRAEVERLRGLKFSDRMYEAIKARMFDAEDVIRDVFSYEPTMRGKEGTDTIGNNMIPSKESRLTIIRILREAAKAAEAEKETGNE